jgi:hypothetical protein
LYRLYHKAADEIESRAGRIIRVRLDYELKPELYSRLARASRDKSRAPETLREEVAERFHLKTVSGKKCGDVHEWLHFGECRQPRNKFFRVRQMRKKKR